MNSCKEDLSWQHIVDARFEDFEEFSAQIHGWDLDFRQLESGKSPAELLQFGRTNFHITRFYMEQAYDQRGATSPNAMTVGLLEDGIEMVTTADGILQQNGVICFPSGSEFSCVSRSRFKGYTLTIADSLVDEVAESTGLQRARAKMSTSQMVQFCRGGNISAMRQQLRYITSGIEQSENTSVASNVIREMEFDLIRELLSVATNSQAINMQILTPRKKIVLQRAMDFIEANKDKPITVMELSLASGAGVRALEYVFRDYFDVTPKTYLKLRRLIAVRQELRRSLPAKSLIQEIAGRWGFWHMGQFAADYRLFFGELPSETLKKHRRVNKH